MICTCEGIRPLHVLSHFVTIELLPWPEPSLCDARKGGCKREGIPHRRMVRAGRWGRACGRAKSDVHLGRSSGHPFVVRSLTGEVMGATVLRAHLALQEVFKV
jgi:hypothetical protein